MNIYYMGNHYFNKDTAQTCTVKTIIDKGNIEVIHVQYSKMHDYSLRGVWWVSVQFRGDQGLVVKANSL